MRKLSLLLLPATLLCSAPSLQAAELGRLFYTPQERQQLEYQQASDSAASGGTNNRSTIIVNGVVQKQGGNRIVWINGMAHAAGRGNDKTPASVPVTVPGKSNPVQLQVGQRLMLDTMSPRKPAEAKSTKTTPAAPNPDEDD
ncbi:MAG TPA: hypothetical protein VK149_04730 [Sideroxyarcus sp.]|nr:hypothetical protein [Sideroxyarcus sp.]